ncbi:MAG TPA: VOC family protein [Nocardioidaceae bacterium]|nr:VOC family protein [Nocardioidaceae bacterium]
MTARARWKELCMDTSGDDALGRFWADVLGLEFAPSDDVVGDVVGDVEGKGIAMCKVPEDKTVKQRVHIDVHAGSVQELVDKGASVVLPAEESGFPWTVLRDPEGGEFCAFLRDDVPDYRFFQLVVDAENAEEIARWWAGVLGTEATSHSTPDWWGMRDVPDMPFERLTFGQVPEPKTVKNRIHWDLYADVADMEAAGARVLREQDDEIGWTVMADPEGNEFCVFEARGSMGA